MGECIRLQKILAQAGYGSRRSCETFILEGRVTVDGTVVSHLGTRADPETQVITLDGERVAGPGKAGKRLHEQSAKVYYALNKPVGVLCTNHDPSGRPLAIQMIPEKRRLFCVGRLDLDTEGLLLLTNDGELTHLLTHPRFGVPKTYLAKVDGPVTGFQLAKLKKGVFLSEGRTQGALVRVRKHGQHTSTLEITIREGLNRQVRRMLAAVGLQCRSLRRIKIGPLSLGLLPSGAHRRLGGHEVEALIRAAQSSANPHRSPDSPPQDEADQEETDQDSAAFDESSQNAEAAAQPSVEQDHRGAEGSDETDGWEDRGPSGESHGQALRPSIGPSPQPLPHGEAGKRPPHFRRAAKHDERLGPSAGRPWDRRSDRDLRGDRGERRDERRRGRERENERRPYGKRPEEGGERRLPEKRFDRRRQDDSRTYRKPFERQDRSERPYRKSFDRQERDEGRSFRRPFGHERDARGPREDRGEREGYDRRPRRRDERERRDFRERRPFDSRREGREPERRSGHRGRPQDRPYDRRPGPRDPGGSGPRPWQKRRDDRQRGGGDRGGQRRHEGRRDEDRHGEGE